MGVGFVVNILATIVASLVEIKRKAVAANHNLLDDPKAVIPISVFWLVPQFCLHGVAEVFMSVGHMEFLYDQSPESMRSMAAALYWFMNILARKATGCLIGTSIGEDWSTIIGLLAEYKSLISYIMWFVLGFIHINHWKRLARLCATKIQSRL